MPEFIARGTVKLSGSIFIIEASNLEEAKRMAKAGQHDDRDDSGAEAVDWEIDPATVEPNS